MIQTNKQSIPNNQRTRCEIWTRVMGYHRPIDTWNPGKQAEHKERRYFTERAAAGIDTDATDAVHASPHPTCY